MTPTPHPRIVIIGAGFGGLFVARNLAHKAVDVVLIDRNNFHTFTPLLYQVATCGLGPGEIAYPVRSIFRNDGNIRFKLGEVVAIDYTQKQVTIRSQDKLHDQPYDHLVIAAGSVTNFYSNDRLQHFAFGLKDLSDGVVLRNHILKLFEKAVWTTDLKQREALLTLVVVGGGATGLEVAGALYELYNHVLTVEYRNVEPLNARVILVEALDNLLPTYPARLQQSAREQLESLGVEVMLGEAVDIVDVDHIKLSNGRVIHTHTLVWSAGVKSSPLAAMLDVQLEKGNRIPVDPMMRVIGRDDIYAVGDISCLPGPDGNPYSQLIPVAQQQGKLVASNLLHRLNGEPEEPFVYHDRGVMATIGRRRAVAWPFYRVQLTGFVAWIAWLGLHLIWLMGFRNRLNVLTNWVWNYLTYDRSVRIILERDVTRDDQQDAYNRRKSRTTAPTPGE
jgi:NADH:ubiquinone reductase (H+-translocating)